MDIIDAALNTIATSGASGVPVGAISAYAGSVAPSGWLLCYGQAVSRATYSDLFTAIGITYGPGDGSTTFNVPDLRGRVAAGKDDMGGTAASRLTGSPTGGVNGNTLGNSGGAQGHILTVDQLAQHTHGGSAAAANANATLRTQSAAQAAGPGAVADVIAWRPFSSVSAADLGKGSSGATSDTVTAPGNHSHTLSIDNAGSGDSHNNVQPTLILNYIVKT